MSNDLTHLVLTRLNLRLPEFPVDKNGADTVNDTWMDQRIELFTCICLASMHAQDSRHWRWLIYCDTNTQPRHREALTKLQEEYQCFELVWLPDHQVAEHVRGLTFPAGRLVTTRLDSDDAFHPHAMRMIAEHALKVPTPQVLSFRFGVRSDGDRIQIVHHRFNPFISLVEECGPDREQPLLTVYAKAHGHLGKVAPLTLLPDHPYHLTIIHDRNVANRFTNDRKHFNLLKVKGWQKFIKKVIIGSIRQRFWSAELRRERSWQEVVDTFHIHPQPLPEAPAVPTAAKD